MTGSTLTAVDLLVGMLVAGLATDAVLAIWFHDREDDSGLFQAARKRIRGVADGAIRSKFWLGDCIRRRLAQTALCPLCLAYYCAVVMGILWFFVPVAAMLLATARVAHFCAAYYGRLNVLRELVDDPTDDEPDWLPYDSGSPDIYRGHPDYAAANNHGADAAASGTDRSGDLTGLGAGHQ
jgi:hypothetical protein